MTFNFYIIISQNVCLFSLIGSAPGHDINRDRYHETQDDLNPRFKKTDK
jgi:hypothetical protein